MTFQERGLVVFGLGVLAGFVAVLSGLDWLSPTAIVLVLLGIWLSRD